MTHYIWQEENWPSFLWRSDALLGPLARCNFRRGQLLGRVAALGMGLSEEARAEVLTAEVLQTSAIEGAALSPESVRSSVARRLGMPDACLTKPDRYAEGLVDLLLDATNGYDQPLTLERLHGWQAVLFPTGFSGLHRVAVGVLRGGSAMQVISGPVGRERIHYEAPPGSRVEKEVRHFLSWWHTSHGQIDGLLRAAIAGFWFVSIHPYEDGNGRLARAITDMALAQNEQLSVRYYSLSAQIMQEREAYYAILEKSQQGGLDITEWLHWFLGCFERAILGADAVIGTVLDKARFWEAHRGVLLTARQRKVVNRLLDAGRGGFTGGLTTRKYAGMTKASRATSYREISDLLEKKLLTQNPGQGRSVSYDLTWPE